MERTLLGLFFAGFCILLTACGTGGSAPPVPPPTPPQAQVAIISPADGDRVTALARNSQGELHQWRRSAGP